MSGRDDGVARQARLAGLLLPSPGWRPLALPEAQVTLDPCWLPPHEADALLAVLSATIPWRTHRIRLFGREVVSPRLSCWIGDAGVDYTYSGTCFRPQPWPPELAALRERIAAACDTRFNSVLANLYRDGNDSMGWHSDDEPELGAQPVIASLSLGAERVFRLRRRLPPGAPPAAMLRLELPHGSLLRMAGDTQRLYQHELPKSRAVTAARINLTFRWVQPRRV